MLQQSSPVLEPTTAGGEAASRAASSVKPACTATTSPLNWLADLTSGNVNKENKGEHFLPFGVLEYLQRDWAAKIAVRARLGVLQHGKCSLLSSRYTASSRELRELKLKSFWQEWSGAETWSLLSTELSLVSFPLFFYLPVPDSPASFLQISFNDFLFCVCLQSLTRAIFLNHELEPGQLSSVCSAGHHVSLYTRIF